VVIPNCQYYASRARCLECFLGFFRTHDGNCQVSFAQNCKEFSSRDACSACHSGFGLKTENGLTSCVSLYLPNCLNSTGVFPFSCAACYPGFYLSEQGTCLQVSLEIPGCQNYSGPTTCSQCQTWYSLHEATGRCQPSNAPDFTAGCDVLVSLSQPECSVCQPGYLLTSSSTCSPFSTNSTGCVWRAQNSTRPCDICRFGYKHTADGLCIYVAAGNSSFIESRPAAADITGRALRILVTAFPLIAWALVH
jgi:hypothetical protein